MDIIRFSLNNPVKVSVGVLLILLFGVLAVTRIPIQLTPDVSQPVITITTRWEGRSPSEIERDIIEPQEDVLKNVSRLRKMTATANVGTAQIELQFDIGTDIKQVRQEVSDSLREVREYPADVDEPVITDGDGGAEAPVAWLILTAEDPDFDVQSLGDIIEDRLKPDIERLPGVSEVRVYGGRAREIHIEIDIYKLAYSQITFNELSNALRMQNVNVSAGDLEEGIYEVRIRTVGQFEDFEQILQTVVRDTPGGPIRVRDIANVKHDFSKRRGFVRSRGDLALALPVYRETGGNVISIMERVNARLVDINQNVLPIIAEQVRLDRGLDAAPKLHLRRVYDDTGYIFAALALVRNNIFIGGTLAICVLLLFLRSIRPTLVVAMAIPISIIGAFVIMQAAGRNLNVISLAGMAFAVGMVVDAAIVVLENIDRHLSMGKSPRKAAYDGTKEVWGAILASSLTTLAVFVPVLTVEEEAGQLFRDIALAICAAVTLSLVVSVTVIPTSSAKLLRSHRQPRLRITTALRSLFGLTKVLGGAADRFAGTIHALIRPTLVGVVSRAGIVLLFTVTALGLSMWLMPPTDYLPRGNQNLVFGALLTPPGYNVTHNEYMARRVEARVRPYWEAQTMADTSQHDPPIHPFTQQPIHGIPPIDNYFIVQFFGGVFTGATSGTGENVPQLAELLTSAMNTLPASVGFAQQRSLFGRGLGGTRSIEVEILGNDLDSVRASAEALMGPLRARFGAPMVQPNPRNFDLPGPEQQIVPDPVRASEMGIDTAALGLGIQALVDGVRVGDFRQRGDSIPIKMVRDPGIELDPRRLQEVPFAYISREGERGITPLATVLREVPADAPQQINRIEELRAVTLNVTPPDDQPLEAASQEIQRMVDDLRQSGQIAPDIVVHMAGSASKLAEVREALLGQWFGWTWATLLSLINSRIFLALLVTYLLMAALFESYLYPFVIMFTVPLATVGGFLGLAIVHWFEPTQQLDVLTMLGFIILIGVVVNNAILIVHQALNFMRGQGESAADQTDPLPPREAIRESVRTRFRPVFMTTMTSVGGMLPLVVMPGSGSELYRGLGSVVVGGLLVSMLFTLIVVPLLFSLVMDAKLWTYRQLGWDAEEESTPKPATA